MQMNQRDLSYSESLMMFVKDLGPTAQMVAKRKLNQIPTSDSQVEAPLSQVSSAFTSTPFKPSTQDFVSASSYQKLIYLFPRSQTTQIPVDGIIDLPDADEEENAYYTSEKMCNLGNQGLSKRNEMSVFRVKDPQNKMGSYSYSSSAGTKPVSLASDMGKLADKALIFSNSGTNSKAELKERSKKSSSSSSWLSQASGLSSLSQTNGSTDSLNSRSQAAPMLAPSNGLSNSKAQANHNLEPNGFTSSVRFTFDLPFFQSQMNHMNYIQQGFGNEGSIFDHRGYIHNMSLNCTHQEEPSTHSFLNGQLLSGSLDIPDTDLALQL